jgi:hypothetical protein
MNLAFLIKEKIQLLPLSQLEYAIEKSFISPETLFFDNSVLTKGELMNKWIVPVSSSWLGKRLFAEGE